MAEQPPEKPADAEHPSASSQTSMTLRTLQQYRELAADKEKIPLLTRDGTAVQFLAYVLEDRDDDIVTSALETILLLCTEPGVRRELRRTYGLLQALECLKLKDSSQRVLSLADDALSQLRQEGSEASGDATDAGAAAPAEPAGLAQAAALTRPGPVRPAARHKVVTLHVQGLVTADDRDRLESQLVRVRGLISIVFDMARGRCTCRVRDTVSVATLAAAVDRTEGMAAYQLVKPGDADEHMVPVSKRAKEAERPSTSPGPLPEYLPEDDPEPVPGEGAVAPDGFFKSAKGWISSASSFLSQSFYW